MSRQESIGDLHDLLGVIRASPHRKDAGGTIYVSLHVEPLVGIIEYAISELSAENDGPSEKLIASLKVALEHDSHDPRVLLGRLLTELERRTT